MKPPNNKVFGKNVLNGILPSQKDRKLISFTTFVESEGVNEKEKECRNMQHDIQGLQQNLSIRQLCPIKKVLPKTFQIFCF